MYLRTNVPFQYTISEDREQVFLLYYKDFFEQICSDVQFISPPEEVGEFLLHLLNLAMCFSYFRDTLLCAKRSIPQPRIRVVFDHRQRTGTFEKPGLQLGAVEVRIMRVNNSPLHEKRCGAGDKGGCKRGTCSWCVTSSRSRRHDIDAGSRQLRLHSSAISGISPPGKC